MTENSDKNRFTDAGVECVYTKDDYRLYKIENYYQFVKCGYTTGYCCMRNRAEWEQEYMLPLYAIVKILPKGIKIVGGADVGFGTFRYKDNKVIHLKQAREMIDIIDHIYTDDVIENITPKNKWETDLPIQGEEVIPDMWFIRKVSDRVNSAVLRNKKILEIVYQHKHCNNNIDM